MFCDMARAFTKARQRLVCFVEKDIREICEQQVPSSLFVNYTDLDSVSTFLSKFEDLEQSFIDSEEYKRSVPEQRRLNPEHNYAAYNLINHSKINFIAAAKKMYPMYDYYMWTDFGCPDYPTEELNVSAVCPKNKVTYGVLTMPPAQRKSIREMLSNNDIYFMGSQFIVHTNAVHLYETMYLAQLRKFHEERVSDDDQNVVYQMTHTYPYLFNLAFVQEWFCLFRKCLNVQRYDLKQTPDSKQSLCRVPWNKDDTRETLFQVFAPALANGTMVEIGTHEGIFANFLLRSTENTKLYCVDPYVKYDDYDDVINDHISNNLYLKVITELNQKFPFRVCMLPLFARDAVHSIPDNIDLLYINGNHKYKYVFEELTMYYNKVRSGGVIIGDDAVDEGLDGRDKEGNITKVWNPGHGKYGVIKAFTDFIQAHNISNWRLFGTQFVIIKD